MFCQISSPMGQTLAARRVLNNATQTIRELGKRNQLRHPVAFIQQSPIGNHVQGQLGTVTTGTPIQATLGWRHFLNVPFMRL